MPFATVAARAEAILADDGVFVDSALEITTPAQARAVGSATYTGIAVVGRQSDVGAGDLDFLNLGTASASVNFVSGDITGSAGDFFAVEEGVFEDGIENASGQAVAGQLAFSLTEDAVEEGLFVGTVDGFIANVNGDRFNIDQAIAGAVLGPQAEALGMESIISEDNFGVAVFAEKN